MAFTNKIFFILTVAIIGISVIGMINNPLILGS